jgi:hypothetical protein
MLENSTPKPITSDLAILIYLTNCNEQRLTEFSVKKAPSQTTDEDIHTSISWSTYEITRLPLRCCRHPDCNLKLHQNSKHT